MVLLAGLALAGCTTTIPDYALLVQDPALPGAHLYAWLEPGDNRTTVHAYFDNDAGRPLVVRDTHVFGAWNLTFLDAAGQPVRFDHRLGCPRFFDNILPDGGERDLRYTWLHRDYERTIGCSSDPIPRAQPVAAGEYTAVIQVLLPREGDTLLEARLPFVVE